ncbi:MAG: transcription antitermination factor NusB [Firmicutes bacterium]|nr:transcription antitermination factor NusB [Bacillota bacterium]
MQRRKARETALQALFQVDVGKIPADAAVMYAIAFNDLSEDTAVFSRSIVEGVTTYQEQIDEAISRWAVDWSLERLANVDRNILRIAFYELLFCPEIPEGVAISEAVEIAKDFGDDDSSRFVNGILGQFSRDRRG